MSYRFSSQNKKNVIMISYIGVVSGVPPNFTGGGSGNGDGGRSLTTLLLQ